MKYWAFLPRVYDRNVPILLESFVENNTKSEQKTNDVVDDDDDDDDDDELQSHDLQTQEEIQGDFNSMCDDVLSRLSDRHDNDDNEAEEDGAE